MVILHIAHVDTNLCAGVNVAVPGHVSAQQKWAQVGLVNLAQVAPPDVQNVFALEKARTIHDLKAPFCSPDLVVFHEVYRPAYLRLSAYLRRRGIPYVIVPHGSLTKAARRKKWLKKKIAGLLFFDHFVRGAAAIQCLSEQERSSTPAAVTFVGTNGVDAAQRVEPFSQSGLRMIYIGRLEMHLKGLDLLVRAADRERTLLEAAGCSIAIYGPEEHGNRAKLIQLIQRYDLSHLISVHPAVLGEEKRQILRAADCFIQTSRSEGMSMGLLEALGQGLPCIVTQGTCIAGLLRQYNAGWSCDTSVDGVAAALRTAVNERTLLAEKSAGASTMIAQRFCWEKVAQEALSRYERLVRASEQLDSGK